MFTLFFLPILLFDDFKLDTAIGVTMLPPRKNTKPQKGCCHCPGACLGSNNKPTAFTNEFLNNQDVHYLSDPLTKDIQPANQDLLDLVESSSSDDGFNNDNKDDAGFNDDNAFLRSSSSQCVSCRVLQRIGQ